MHRGREAPVGVVSNARPQAAACRMIDEPAQFDDPALRAAIRTAVGSESAPPALRRRVAALLAAEASAASVATAQGEASIGRTRPHSRWAELRSPRTLAIAAAALLAVGFAVVQIITFFGWPGTAPRYAAPPPATFPASFAAAIIKTHDNCAKLPDHHFVKGDNPVALKDELSRAGGVSASAIDPGDGWQFKGAGMCRIDDAKAAHLLFVRGPESISIFSLPMPPSCHDSAYSEAVSKHSIVGFTSQGALYCVVGSTSSGDLTPAELEPVVSKMRASVGALACDWDVPELMQTAANSSAAAAQDASSLTR